MKVLVTGGAGFIGSTIADALVGEGHDVHILDDLSGGNRRYIPDAAIFHELSITSNEAAGLVEDQRYEAIFHLAAQMDVRKSVSDPVFDAGINVIGFLNMMEAARSGPLKKVVFSSTGGAIYGEPDYVPQDEAHPIRPMSPYGITKRVSELYLDFYRLVHGIDYVALRYANVYGPRQNPHGEAGVVAIFIRRMLENRQAVINGDGEQTRDFVYVDDVVRANLAALNLNGSGVFNIGTGIETNVNQLFRALRSLSGSGMDEKHVDGQPGEQMRSVLGFEKARETLDWAPQVSLSDGLRRTIDWFRTRQEND